MVVGPRCAVVGAAQGPGPPLRPPGRCASLVRLPVRAALDPGDLCGPWGRRSGQAGGLPRARGVLGVSRAAERLMLGWAAERVLGGEVGGGDGAGVAGW